MREVELRQKTVKVAERYLGYNEKNNQDDIIIRKYNEINAAGMYDMAMNDSWCAAFSSVVGYEAGFSEIIPIECSCQRQIELWKKLGRWEEDGTIIPLIGDYIYYNWDDGIQPNDGWADHVGIVVKIVGNKITIIEGNKNDSVEYRTIRVGWGYIRGYGRPDYAKLSTAETHHSTPTHVYSLGDIVEFTGDTHYTSSYSGGKAKQCKSGKAEVTAVSLGKPHPYHLVGIDVSTVYGWVNESDIKGEVKIVDGNIKKGDVVKVIANVTYSGKPFKAYYDEYDVIQVTCERVVIGKGDTVTCSIHIDNIKKV